MDLAQWIERHAAFSPDKLAIRSGGEELTYGAFAVRLRRTLARLVALGVQRGDVVAFLGFNNPETLALLFACARLGAVLLPLNWRLASPEHARVLADCLPRLILVETAFVVHARSLREASPGALWTTLGDAPSGWIRWDDLGQDPVVQPVPSGASDLEAPVLLCYTSGSTGAPKGVMLSQNALFWNALNSTHMHDLTSADHVLTTLPLFHVGGMNIQTVPALYAGASISLHAKFDPSAAIEAIERERITLAVFVPAQLTALMEHPRWDQADLSSLRMLTTGSTIVSESFIRRVHGHGPRLVQVYGSTETCPIATYVRVGDADRKAGSAGLPALHCQVRVVDRDGRELPVGHDGEIVVRGPNVMNEYLNAPPATAAALRDGWYYSGDVGHFDREGYLYVVSRKHDMIISGGENVYPAEIENILLECSSIGDACVVGRADERWGEAIVAVVVLKPGEEMNEAQVFALLDGRIARYKLPREVRFAEALPRSALGKVKREELRREVMAAVAA